MIIKVANELIAEIRRKHPEIEEELRSVPNGIEDLRRMEQEAFSERSTRLSRRVVRSCGGPVT